MCYTHNAAGWCDTFFCFRDVRRAIAFIGTFSLVTSLIQILVQVAVFTGANEASPINVSGGEKEQITYQLYIALAAADFLVVLFAIVMLYGNERSNEIQGRKYLMPWAILLPFYILYESAINIFYFIHQFNSKYSDTGAKYDLSKGHPLGFTIVPLVYWVVKDVILFIGFIFVIMRIQSLRPLITYVQEYPQYESGCRDCGPLPPVAHSPPRISLPPPPAISSCNACSSNKCGGCSKPQPLYGYASGQPSAVKTGWTTSIYNQGR